MDGATVAVGHADRDHGACNAVGDQYRFFTDQRRVHCIRSVMHGAVEAFDDDAVGIAHFGHEAGVAVAQVERAPQCHGDAAVTILARAVERQRADGFAVREQGHCLAGQMLDRDADGLGARVVVGGGEQPGDAGRFTVEPVALGPGSDGFTDGFDAGGRLGRTQRGVDARLRAEIDADQRAALPFDKA